MELAVDRIKVGLINSISTFSVAVSGDKRAIQRAIKALDT